MTSPVEVSSCQAIVLESVINVALNIHCSFLLLIYQIVISNIFALQCISVINFTCTGNITEAELQCHYSVTSFWSCFLVLITD